MRGRALRVLSQVVRNWALNAYQTSRTITRAGKTCARTCARTRARTCFVISEKHRRGDHQIWQTRENGYLRLFIAVLRERRALCARFEQIRIDTAEGIIKSARTEKSRKARALRVLFALFGLVLGRSRGNGQECAAWSAVLAGPAGPARSRIDVFL